MIGVGVVDAWSESAVFLREDCMQFHTCRVIDGGARRAAWKVPVTLSAIVSLLGPPANSFNVSLLIFSGDKQCRQY